MSHAVANLETVRSVLLATLTTLAFSSTLYAEEVAPQPQDSLAKPQLWVGGFLEGSFILGNDLGASEATGVTLALQTPHKYWVTTGVGFIRSELIFEQAYTGIQIPLEFGRQLSPYILARKFSIGLSGGANLFISVTPEREPGWFDSHPSKPIADLFVKPLFTWQNKVDRRRFTGFATAGARFYYDESSVVSPMISLGTKLQFNVSKK